MKPLSQDIANFNTSRLADKTELTEKMNNLSEKVENDLKAMKKENNELIEKMRVLEAAIQNNTLKCPSLVNISAIPTFSPDVRTETTAPIDVGEVPNPEEVKKIVLEAKKVISLQPIPDEDIDDKMKELNIVKDKATIDVIYTLLENELGIKNVRNTLKIKSFDRPNDKDPKQNKDRLNVAFATVEDTRTIFQHVKNIIDPDLKVMCWVPDSFSKRFRKMNDIAYKLRRSSVPSKTSIRWGEDDLILQQRRSNLPFWETVHLPNLPLVQLNTPTQTS